MIKEKSVNYQLGVYIKLPKEWREKIGTIKQEFSAYNNIYGQEAHLSLYICALKSIDHFDNFCLDLKNKLYIKSFELTLDKVKMKNYFYYLDVKPHDILEEIHQRVLFIAQIHREGLIRKKDLERLKTYYYTQKEKLYLKAHGFARVFDLFEPHITLGDLKLTQKKVNINLLQKQIDDIGLKMIQIKSITVAIFEENNWCKMVKEELIKFKS